MNKVKCKCSATYNDPNCFPSSTKVQVQYKTKTGSIEPKEWEAEIKDICLSYIEPLHSWYAEQGLPKYSKQTKSKVKEFQDEVVDCLISSAISLLKEQELRHSAQLAAVKSNSMQRETVIKAELIEEIRKAVMEADVEAISHYGSAGAGLIHKSMLDYLDSLERKK